MRIRILVAAGGVALLFGGVLSPADAMVDDPARGTIKIEETEVSDADPPNEVKVGCDFSLEFFGMAAGEVPIRFSLMPPSGEGLFATRTAQVQEASGSDPSGSLDVDLTEDLSTIQPAQAEDFDYKLRVEAVVKTTSGGSEVTKSAVLFIICEPARAAALAALPQSVRGGVRIVDKCGRAGDTFLAKRVKGVTYRIRGTVAREGAWLHARTRTVRVRAEATTDRYQVVGRTLWTLRFTNQPCPTPPQVLPATGA